MNHKVVHESTEVCLFQVISYFISAPLVHPGHLCVCCAAVERGCSEGRAWGVEPLCHRFIKSKGRHVPVCVPVHVAQIYYECVKKNKKKTIGITAVNSDPDPFVPPLFSGSLNFWALGFFLPAYLSQSWAAQPLGASVVPACPGQIWRPLSFRSPL